MMIDEPTGTTRQTMSDGEQPRAGSLTARWRAAIALPLAVMLVVAGAQIARAKWGILAPDKGGAFGMFATVDQLANRVVRIVVIDASGREASIGLPPIDSELGRYIYDTQPYPTDERLRHIGEEVVRLYRERGVAAARVEVWRVGFDSPKREMSRELMTQVTVEAAQ